MLNNDSIVRNSVRATRLEKTIMLGYVLIRCYFGVLFLKDIYEREFLMPISKDVFVLI